MLWRYCDTKGIIKTTGYSFSRVLCEDCPKCNQYREDEKAAKELYTMQEWELLFGKRKEDGNR